MEIPEAEFERANARMARLREKLPHAVAAEYDVARRRIVVSLSSGIEVAFAPDQVQGLEQASPADLDEIEISPAGFDLHFPKVDADIYLPALLEGFFGSRKWMAARLGAKGGKAVSEKKREAVRNNGKLGGRPPKNVGEHAGSPSEAPATRGKKQAQG